MKSFIQNLAKTILVITAICFLQPAFAQFKVNEKPVKNTQNLQRLNQVPPPPPPTNPPTSPNSPNNNLYYLTSVKVDIYTGNDNKEFSSKMSIDLVRSGGAPSEFGNSNPGNESLLFSRTSGNSETEMKTNSITSVALESIYHPEEGRYTEVMNLYKVQQYGLKLKINYIPNFILDAWKIDRVSMTLEFKDAQGNPHPIFGSKTILFMNASALLTDSKSNLICETDGFLMPKN